MGDGPAQSRETSFVSQSCLILSLWGMIITVASQVACKPFACKYRFTWCRENFFICAEMFSAKEQPFDQLQITVKKINEFATHKLLSCSFVCFCHSTFERVYRKSCHLGCGTGPGAVVLSGNVIGEQDPFSTHLIHTLKKNFCVILWKK